MDARSAVGFALSMAMRLLVGHLVIRFAAPREDVGEVDQIVEPREHFHRATAMRADTRRELPRMDPKLGIPVVVEIQLFIRQRLASPQLALAEGQLVPDRVTEMGQIEAAEYAVPIVVVALPAPDGPASGRRIAPAARQVR